MRMGDRAGDRVRRVVRPGDFRQPQAHAHHLLHLLLLRVAVAGDGLLDLHRRVFKQLVRIALAGCQRHTARARNDQVAVDVRMYVRREIPVIIAQLLELEEVLCKKARQHQMTVMPGYTHLQRAQPISFAQHLLAYGSMFRRDITRLEDCAARLNECPLGSGALAGTTYPIDRWETAKLLAFDAPMMNSLDGVSDRDYALELLSGLAILMMHMSRFA